MQKQSLKEPLESLEHLKEQWMKSFLNHLQNSCGSSLNTLKAYERDLNLYKSYFQTFFPNASETNEVNQTNQTDEVNEADNASDETSDETSDEDQTWDKLYAFMRQKGLGTRSQARVISCLKSYFKFLHGRGVPVPEFSFLVSPAFKHNLPHLAYEESFLKLLDACSHHSNAAVVARNQFCLKLLFGLGCRVSELVAIDTTDYQLSPPWIKLKGKGEKERMLPLPKGLQQDLENYITQHRPSLLAFKSGKSGKSAKSGNFAQSAQFSKTGHSRERALLLNNRGKRPSRVDIWRWIKKWSQIANLEQELSPHAFRHGFATSILKNGGDLRSVQALLGHSNIQTTQVYTHLKTQDLKEALLNHHPLCINTKKASNA